MRIVAVAGLVMAAGNILWVWESVAGIDDHVIRMANYILALAVLAPYNIIGADHPLL